MTVRDRANSPAGRLVLLPMSGTPGAGPDRSGGTGLSCAGGTGPGCAGGTGPDRAGDAGPGCAGGTGPVRAGRTAPGHTGGPWAAHKAHRSYLDVAAEPGAVPYARRCTRQALAAWGLGEIAGDAELVVSELMTNAVRATLGLSRAAHVVLYLAADPGRLTLLVWDACAEPPVRRPHDADSAGGRGLEIVQALSDRWGTQAPVRGGKVVWAWFDLDRP
jgi:serine/threonine-protein kinase RsbW